MKKILIILAFILFNSSLFAADKKPGRFFEDQPDVNDDYQIHFIYTLAADSKDREWDINGKIEKIADKMMLYLLEVCPHSPQSFVKDHKTFHTKY